MTKRGTGRAAILLYFTIAWLSGTGFACAGDWGIELNNDSPMDTDRHYSHGTRLFWVSRPDETPARARTIAAAVPRIAGPGTLQLGASIGQNIYTPDDLSRADLVVDDRPYAGWLYGSLALSRTNDNNRRAWEVDLGMVGPASLARQTQILVHEIIGGETPRGWSHQLKNEPGVVLLYEEMWQHIWEPEPGAPRFAITPHIAGSLGNVHTYASTGASLRFGRFADDDFGPARIQPGVPGSYAIENIDGIGWYLFAGFDARLVGRNIFLDGNTFADSHSVDSKPFVADGQVGLNLTFSRARFTLMYVVRSKEFDGQVEKSRFAAAQFGYRF